MGSWVGGRIGLMVYDVVNGVQILLQFVQPEESEVYENQYSEASQVSYIYETPNSEEL